MGTPVAIAEHTPSEADLEEMHRLVGLTVDELQQGRINLYAAGLREETLHTLFWRLRTSGAVQLRELTLAGNKGLTDLTVEELARSLPAACM